MLKEDCCKEQISDNELFINSILWVDLGYWTLDKKYMNYKKSQSCNIFKLKNN